MNIVDILITILCASVVLSLLVFIHEGGHFLAARAFGVRVTEFMIGLPGPRLSFKRGETRFGVTCIPLGGYARICGMEAGEESPHLKPVLKSILELGTAEVEDVASACGITFDEAEAALDELVEWGCVVGPRRSDKLCTYRAAETPKPTWRSKRAARKAASAAAAPAGAEGVQSQAATASQSVLHQAQRPAEDAAMPAAPLATDRRYAEGESRPVPDIEALYQHERSQQYRSLPFWKRAVILVAGVFVNLLFAMVCFVIIYSVLGFDYQYPDTGEIRHIVVDPLRAIYAGFMYLGAVVGAVVSLFNPATAADTVSNSTSIVGIAVMSKSAFEQGLVSVLSFMAMISASLGIMNLIPIPPLDGGRLLVEIIQKISRRTVSQKVLSRITLVGVAAFMCFFVVMLNQDVQRFILGNW